MGGGGGGGGGCLVPEYLVLHMGVGAFELRYPTGFRVWHLGFAGRDPALDEKAVKRNP